MGTGIALGAAGVAVAGAGVFAWRKLNPRGLFFDSNGVRIHYTVWGQGAPVVLVHGLGINGATNWGVPGILSKLAKRYQVFVIDVRGHGRSAKPHDPSQYGAAMADDVARLLDHVKMNKAHVVGYSMGGFITLKVLVSHPDRLYSAAPCGAGWSSQTPKDLGFLLDLADSLDKGTGFMPLMKRLQPVGERPNPLRDRLINAIMLTINDVKALTALLRTMGQLEVSEADLRNNKVPCLGIVGDKDPLKEFADQMAAVTANMQYLVVRGDHMTTPFRRESIQTLQAFLEKHTPK